MAAAARRPEERRIIIPWPPEWRAVVDLLVERFFEKLREEGGLPIQQPIITVALSAFYDITRMTYPKREQSVILDFDLDPGESGTITLPIPKGKCCIQREMQEAGDYAVKYSLYIDGKGADSLAISEHRVATRTLPFARRWEKYNYIYISYENTDDARPAWFQFAAAGLFVDAERWRTLWKPRVVEIARQIFPDIDKED